MAEAPLVSVVIPTYNRARLLPRTLESVAAQDYRPVEVIVVDDASEDQTQSVLEQALPRLRRAGIAARSTVLPRNSGPAAARNAGLCLAAGVLIAFLASDDLWTPTFLSVLVGLMDRFRSCAVAFSGHVGIDVNDKPLEVPGATSKEIVQGRLTRPFEQFIASFPLITAGTLVRKEALDAVGWFDESLASWEDADLWYRLAKRFDFAYTTEPLASYRLHAGNITNRRLDWFEYQLQVRLRHFDDIRDPSTRQVAIENIQRTQVLLQEQVLREGVAGSGYRQLLDNKFAPTSLRYRLGQLALQSPSALRRLYAGSVRGVGNVRRASLAFAHALTLRT
jgi:glycosyltransferase involved in cell wall biosynthesis